MVGHKEANERHLQLCTVTTHSDVQALEFQQREQQVQALVGKATSKAQVLQALQVPPAQQGPHQVEAANCQHTQPAAGRHSRQTCRAHHQEHTNSLSPVCARTGCAAAGG